MCWSHCKHNLSCRPQTSQDYAEPDDTTLDEKTQPKISNGAVNKERVTIESTTYETAQAKSGTTTVSAGKGPQKMSTTCSAETSTEGGYNTQPELNTREASHPQRGRVRLAAHQM